MDIMYKETISAQIDGEEWKINIILDIVDCLNGLCGNDFTYDENMFLLSDICITWHQYQIFYIILSSQPLYHKCIFLLYH